jgi:hypothetical protein
MHLTVTIKSSFFYEILLNVRRLLKTIGHRGQSNTANIISTVCKRNTMKQDNQIHLTSQAPWTWRGESPVVVSVHA